MSAISVLHITSAIGGGAERYVRDLASTTTARHWIWHASVGAIEDVAKGRFHREPDDSSLATWLRSEATGLVHLHGVARPCAAALARVRATSDIAHVVTLHDMGFVAPGAFDDRSEFDPGETARVAPLLEQAARVIAPSEFIAGLLRQHFATVACDIIAPGIDPHAAVAASAGINVSTEFAAHAHRSRIAVLGAIGPHKGSGKLPSIGRALAALGHSLVVIGYTDWRRNPGWQTPGELYIHGAYDEGTTRAWLDAYDADIVLFANRMPESFSYTLSEAWAARRPVIVPDIGALGERVTRFGGGWRLSAQFDAQDVATLVAQLRSADGAHELAQVESSIDVDDPQQIPTLAAMTDAFDRLYARHARPGAPSAGAGKAVLTLLVDGAIDGSGYRGEFVRLLGRLCEAESWRDKLECDIAELKMAIERLGEDNRNLADVRDAFERMPSVLQRYLLRQAFRDRD